MRARFPARKGRPSWGWDGRAYAINDISIVNEMSVAPRYSDGIASGKTNLEADPTLIQGLGELLATSSAS
jgi:hypothetical protein